MQRASERRRRIRTTAQFRAWVRSDDGPYVRAETLDLHQGGLQLRLDRRFSKNDLVDLCLKLDQGEPVALRGLVCWVVPEASGGYRLGLALVGKATVDSRRLERWCHSQQLVRRVS